MLSLPDKNFQPILFILFKFSYRQNIVLKPILRLNTPKITSFLLKNRKNRPALWVDPLCSQKGKPLSPTSALFRYEFFAVRLIITSTFTWHKEKDDIQYLQK